MKIQLQTIHCYFLDFKKSWLCKHVCRSTQTALQINSARLCFYKDKVWVKPMGQDSSCKIRAPVTTPGSRRQERNPLDRKPHLTDPCWSSDAGCAAEASAVGGCRPSPPPEERPRRRAELAGEGRPQQLAVLDEGGGCGRCCAAERPGVIEA